MNQMNFFTWIRDGVRQSVLLGVSDAIEQLGTPASSDEIHPSVAGFLNGDRQTNENGTPKLTASATSGPKGRKRLGKSLKELGSEASS